MEQALSYLNQDEKNVLSKIEKIIIWGFPLHSHTHSYIHACWVKTFQTLGKEVHWFHDATWDKEMSYENCLFITEGYADKNIPIVKSSIYFVHNAVFPQKYLSLGVRLIEIRFQVREIHDVNNDFNIDDGTHIIENLSEDTLYEKLTSTKDLSKEFTGPTPQRLNYECIYLYWATDLFPWEINLNDAELVPKETLHFVGSPTGDSKYDIFYKLCRQRGIETILHNPWEAPISFEENRLFIRDSCVTVDFRPEGSQQDKEEYGEKNGKNHLAIGYVPCRLFKNISYGNIPCTDSPHARDLLGDAIVYGTDINNLVLNGIAANKDIDRKKRAMKMVADRHTYIHRVRDLLRAILKPRPEVLSLEQSGTWNQVTIVTALLHIGREGADGRTMEQYIQWFAETLKIPAPMVVYVEPGFVEIVKQIRGALPTKIIPQSLGTSPFGWSFPKVHEILESQEWKQKMKNPGDLTNKLPGYSIVTNNKFAWLWNAMEENPFGTDMFFWIDGGLSRFFKNYDIQHSQPHIRLIRDIRKSRKIFTVIGGGKEHYINNAIQGKRLPTEEVIGANMGVVMTGFFGGHISTMKHASEYVMKNYVVEMIQKNRIDHDQSSIFLHFQENPDKYLLVPPHPQLDCFNFFLFVSGQHFPIGV